VSERKLNKILTLLAEKINKPESGKCREISKGDPDKESEDYVSTNHNYL
jgi:hypothetical protein